MSSTIEITGGSEYGLSHSLSNWKAAVVFAWHSKRLLIPPVFNLTGRHNNGNKISKCDLSDYVNFENVLVNSKKILVSTPGTDHKTFQASGGGGLWRLDSKIQPVFEKHAGKCKITPLQPSDSVLRHAEAVSERIGKYNCVHVRMTDHPCRKDMTPQNISNLIDQKFERSLPIYVMTDHPKKTFFNFLLKSGWDVVFYDDFPELVDVKDKDNYMLFAIERHLMSLARCKISRGQLVVNHKKIIN
jgi:hypothetical protein